MKYKFIMFMKNRFTCAGAFCPMYRWEQFIYTFETTEREKAWEFTQRLIDNHYIGKIEASNGEIGYAITGMGYEHITKGILEVTL